MDSEKLENLPSSRRCYSEPPLVANRPLSTITQHTSRSSAYSLQDIKPSQVSQFPRQNTYRGFRGNSAVRSSTFPLLPALNYNKKTQDMGLKSMNGEAHNERFPSFKNLPFNNRENILAQKQGGLQGRKYQLRSRYITEMKQPSPPKQPQAHPTHSNPLRKRVQEIEDVDETNTKTKSEELDEISEMYLNSCQSNLRRLSVITEKSNFSKTSTKTMLFDLEEDNGLQMSTLPGIEKEFRRTRRPPENFDRKHSEKLHEHLKITGKQFDPLETKAALLSNWFQTLQTR